MKEPQHFIATHDRQRQIDVADIGAFDMHQTAANIVE
jgi:hypothetical protein